MGAKTKRGIMISIFLIGLIAIMLVVLTALSAELRQENNQLIKENQALQGEVDTLTVQIKTANNVANIEKIAIEEYGMTYPDEDECIYITEEDEPEKNFAAVIRQEAYN